MNGRRRPQRLRKRSLRMPIRGSLMPSQKRPMMNATPARLMSTPTTVTVK